MSLQVTGIWRWQQTFSLGNAAGRQNGPVRGLVLDVECLDFPEPSPFMLYRTLGNLVFAAEVCEWGELCKHRTGVAKCWSSEPHLWSHNLISPHVHVL